MDSSNLDQSTSPASMQSRTDLITIAVEGKEFTQPNALSIT